MWNWKKNLAYQGHYEYQYVNTNKINNTLSYLWEWCNPLKKTEELQSCATENMSKDKSHDMITNDTFDKSLYDQQHQGMSIDMFVTCWWSKKWSISVVCFFFCWTALSEYYGMKQKKAKCFQMLFSSERGTYHEPNKEKLPLCTYFNACIVNADGRFAKNLLCTVTVWG